MSETFAYDNLFAGSQRDIVNRIATVALAQSLSRGDLVGRILRAIGAAAADPGNTGEGTIDDEALGAKAVVGTYTATCVDIGTPAIFEVVDPNGLRLEDAYAEEAYDGPVAFLIEAYGTAFAVGDVFTVVVGAGSLQVIEADLGGLDGSAEPYGIMAEDVDATAAATRTTVYTEGEFSEDNVGYAAGEDADDWRELCAAKGIYLRATTAV